MQIIKDPNNPEVRKLNKVAEKHFKDLKNESSLCVFLQGLDSDQGSNESDTEQRNKALRGRM